MLFTLPYLVSARLPVVLVIDRLGTGGTSLGQTMLQHNSFSFSAKSSAKHAHE